MKQKRVHSNGVFGVRNGVADNNTGCDVCEQCAADANEDFEVVGEDIGQDVADSEVGGNVEVGVNSDDLWC